MRLVIAVLIFSLATYECSFVKSTYYGDSYCGSQTSYTVFRQGKCQTLSSSGIKSSTVNTCGSSQITSTVYQGTCDSGVIIQKINNPIDGCIVNGGNMSSTVITCPGDFPYVNTSFTDGITVTFAGTSCSGTVYSILVTPGSIPSIAYCNQTKCSSTNINTSKRFMCGNSADLPGYVTSLQSIDGKTANGVPASMMGTYHIALVAFMMMTVVFWSSRV